MIGLIAIASVLAALPTFLFLRNLSAYRPLPLVRPRPGDRPHVSVLIPARNEQNNIAAAVSSVLRSRDVELEVVVLDDDSTDRTREIVEKVARVDRRLRLLESSALPSGWRGKTFACDQLARSAHHSILVFIDADVRLTCDDALLRLATALHRGKSAMLSGIPRQRTGTFLEKLIVPLIHWVLLGFLPMRWMRTGADTRFAAACGQLIAVRRDAYHAAGGHGAVRGSLHDGIELARAFRANGHRTDLFDATDSFRCRMYRRNREVWDGFVKNSTEGLGRPQLLLASTLLLFGGQVLPFLLILASRDYLVRFAAALACAVILVPRLIGVRRFNQSIVGAVLHPIGVLLLVVIQWHGFFRHVFNRPASWRGRSCAIIPAT